MDTNLHEIYKMLTTDGHRDCNYTREVGKLGYSVAKFPNFSASHLRAFFSALFASLR